VLILIVAEAIGREKAAELLKSMRSPEQMAWELHGSR
jgi:hypothetical protein